MKKNFIIFGCLLSLLVMGSTTSFAAAGKFQFVAGDVKITNRAGVERLAVKGMEVEEGDTLTTAANSSAQIKMADEGMMALRPDSKIKVETYVFNGKQDGNERSLILLLKGGFRAITGLIGHNNKDNNVIKTSTATIGIRGTDHEPMFIPEPPPGVKAIAPPGTYDKVNSGATFIKTNMGIININPNQAGFVAGQDKIPQLLPKIPDFYKPSADQPGAGARTDMKGGKDVRLKTDAPNTLGATLKTDTLKSGTLIAPTTLQVAPSTSTTLLAPTTLVAPTTLKTTTSSTTLVAPTTTLIAPTTTLIAPTTTLIAPTTTLIAPTTTLIAPTTTLIAPTTTLIAPTTTLIAPTTTLIAPTTTLIVK